ncbi:MAG: hypothetical protein ACK417_08700 [Bacteroidia bacterium]
MKIDLLLNLVQNPGQSAGAAMPELEALVAEYPYFSAAQLLLLKQYKLQNSSRYQRQLRQVAMRLPDRDQVFSLVEDWHEAPDVPVASNQEDVVEMHSKAVQNAEDFRTDLKEAEVQEAIPEVAEETMETKLLITEDAVETPQTLSYAEAENEVQAEEVLAQVPESNAEVVAITIQDEQPELQQPSEVKESEGRLITTAEDPAPQATKKPLASESTQAEVIDEALDFMQTRHDRLGWFRFFAGKPLREQPDEVLDRLYQEHMQQDFLQAETEVSKAQSTDLKAVINHSEAVPSSKELEEEVKRLAYESISDEDLPASETLAGIYAAQHDYKKAIRIYQKLVLKFPDKITYFADLIEELRKKL